MRFARQVAMMATFLAGVFAPGVSTTAGGIGESPIPADVLARSETARANMWFIAAAMYTYANDGEHFGLFPPDIRMLYPTYISDPAVFWHPGDSDPCPTTIDNTTPNALNSTQTSYSITTATSPDQLPWGAPVVWDNTAANNEGYFVNMVVNAQGIPIRTDPPFVTPTPTRMQVAEQHLLLLSRCIFTYASDGNQGFPNDPSGQFAHDYVPSASLFWNPGDIDPGPTEITNNIPDAINSARISFTFPLGGVLIDSVHPDDIMVQDNSPANNGGAGIWVIRGDGRVEFISMCPDLPADVDGDGDVDLDDFGRLQRCVTRPGERLADGCGCFDRPELPAFPYGDGDVDTADFARFMACFSGPGVPAIPDCDAAP